MLIGRFALMTLKTLCYAQNDPSNFIFLYW